MAQLRKIDFGANTLQVAADRIESLLIKFDDSRDLYVSRSFKSDDDLQHFIADVDLSKADETVHLLTAEYCDNPANSARYAKCAKFDCLNFGVQSIQQWYA